MRRTYANALLRDDALPIMLSAMDLFAIDVKGGSTAESNRLAGELQRRLNETSSAGMRFERRKSDPSTMDAGTLLVAVLTAPAAIALARGPAQELASGIADWLRKRKARISVTPTGGVTVENVDPEDLSKIVGQIMESQRKS